MITDNIISMAELAKINDIKAVICSILPANGYPWKPGMDPAQKINAINRTMKDYAKKSVMVYLDYFSSMVDDKICSEKIIHMMVCTQIKLGTV